MSSRNISWSQVDRSVLASAFARSRYKNNQDGATGLNPQGNAQFRNRMAEIMDENGITNDFSFGQNKDGKFVVMQQHPDKDKIESLLNNDEKLNQICNDPNSIHDTSKGGSKANGKDSSYFSEQAKQLYDERENNGQSAPYASSAEETARVMEWMANQSRKSMHNFAPGGPLPVITNTLHVVNADAAGGVAKTPNKPFDPDEYTYLQTDTIKDLVSTRNWLETEIVDLLEKNGISANDLEGVKFGINGGGISVLAGQEGISRDLGDKIDGILNDPNNQELNSVMKRYLNVAGSVSSQLQRVTGLNDADWQELMAGGKSLADIDNEGMKAILNNDPEFESALRSLLTGGSGFLSGTQDVSSTESGDNVGRALGGTIWRGVVYGKTDLGLSEKDVDNLAKNLRIEVDTGSGNYNVSGTNNNKLLSLIDTYMTHYLSGPFADRLNAAQTMSQALTGSKDNGVKFTFSFENRKPQTTIQYGDRQTKKVTDAFNTYW